MRAAAAVALSLRSPRVGIAARKGENLDELQSLSILLKRVGQPSQSRPIYLLYFNIYHPW